MTAELLKGGLIHGDSPTVTGDSVATNVSGARRWRPDVIGTLEEPLQTAGICDGCAHRQPIPERRRDQGIGRFAISPVTSGPRPRFRLDRGVQPRRRGSRHGRHRRRRACAPLCRPAGLPRPCRNLAICHFPASFSLPESPTWSGSRTHGCPERPLARSCFTSPQKRRSAGRSLVRTGDEISLDITTRLLRLEVDDEELTHRRAEWVAPEPPATRGWVALYVKHVLQADTGCDLDFLLGSSGHEVPRVSH